MKSDELRKLISITEAEFAEYPEKMQIQRSDIKDTFGNRNLFRRATRDLEDAIDEITKVLGHIINLEDEVTQTEDGKKFFKKMNEMSILITGLDLSNTPKWTELKIELPPESKIRYEPKDK